MDTPNVTPRIFLDLDGVLANFDKRAEAILGTDNIYKYEFVYGPEVFWQNLHRDENFFEDLEPMPDAYVLWGALRRFNPFILTALPITGAERVDRQKRQWVKDHFGPDVQVITCRTKDKPNYCYPGDVLVDDRAVNRAAWMTRGGRYVVHTSAADTIKTLYQMEVL